MPIVERGHQPPQGGEERLLVGVRGGGGEAPPELARPVGLDGVEVGVEVLEDVPGQDHVGQPGGPVVAGGGGRSFRLGRRGRVRERALGVPVERQGDERRDAAPEIGHQRLSRLGDRRRIGLRPREQEAALAALRTVRREGLAIARAYGLALQLPGGGGAVVARDLEIPVLERIGRRSRRAGAGRLEREVVPPDATSGGEAEVDLQSLGVGGNLAGDLEGTPLARRDRRLSLGQESRLGVTLGIDLEPDDRRTVRRDLAASHASHRHPLADVRGDLLDDLHGLGACRWPGGGHPLAPVDVRGRRDLHPQVLPVDHLRAGGCLELRRQGRTRVGGGVDPHRGSDGAEEIRQRPGELLGALRRLGRLDAGERLRLPVRGGGLVAGMEVADVAEQAGEGGQVLQATPLQRARRLMAGLHGAQHLEGGGVDPGLAVAQQHQPHDDRLGVRRHLAGDLVGLPLRAADRPVRHVVEEPHGAPLAVHPQPESGAVPAGDLGADRRPEADPLAAIGGGVEVRRQVAEGVRVLPLPLERHQGRLLP